MADDLRIIIQDSGGGNPTPSQTTPPVPPMPPPGGGGGAGQTPPGPGPLPTPPTGGGPTPPTPSIPPVPPASIGGGQQPASPASASAANASPSGPHAAEAKAVVSGLAGEVAHLGVSLARFVQDLGLLLRLHPSSIQRLHHSAPHAKAAVAKVKGVASGLFGRASAFLGGARNRKRTTDTKKYRDTTIADYEADNQRKRSEKKSDQYFRDTVNSYEADNRGRAAKRQLDEEDAGPQKVPGWPGQPQSWMDQSAPDEEFDITRAFEWDVADDAPNVTPATPGGAAASAAPAGGGGGGAAAAAQGAGAAAGAIPAAPGGASAGGAAAMGGPPVWIAAAAVAVVVGAAIAMKMAADSAIALNRSFLDLKDELKDVTPELAVGEAFREVGRFRFAQERGERFGPGLDKLADANHRIEESMTRIADVFRAELLEKLVPLVEGIAGVVDIVASHEKEIEVTLKTSIGILTELAKGMIPGAALIPLLLKRADQIGRDVRKEPEGEIKNLEALMQLVLDPTQAQQAPAVARPAHGGFGGPLGIP